MKVYKFLVQSSPPLLSPQQSYSCPLSKGHKAQERKYLIYFSKNRRRGRGKNTGVSQSMNIMNQQTDETMLFPSIQILEGMGKKVSNRRRRKVMREEGEEGKKKRLSDEQVKFLEKSFRDERKLESARKVHLASEAGLDPKQVAVWFQNRRAKWKSKKMEEEYIKLKSLHEATVMEKCHLQAEVLKLQEELLEAKKETETLSCPWNNVIFGCSGGDGVGGGEFSSSPSTSYSMDNNNTLLNGELDQKGMEDLVFMDDYSYMFDMMNFYGI